VDLAFNRLGDWNEVCKLSKLPRLRRANLTSNPLKTVEFKSEDPEFFKSLESLLLGGKCLLIDSQPMIGPRLFDRRLAFCERIEPFSIVERDKAIRKSAAA